MSSLVDFSQAEKLLSQEKYNLALPLLNSAFKQSQDTFLKAEIAWRQAETLRALGRFQDALKAYQVSHRFYGTCGVASEQVRVLLGVSSCLRVLGQYKQAQKIWAKNLKTKVSDPCPEEIDIEKALVQRGLGHHGEARKILSQCLPRLAQKNNKEILQQALWSLGGVDRFLGAYARALYAYEKAEKIAVQIKDASAQAYALCGQAGCLRILGKGKTSYQKYQKAHAIFKKLKDTFGEAYGLCGMGNAERVWGDPKKTLPLYKSSAKLYAQVGDEGSIAFAFWGLGGSYRRLGQCHEAETYYKKALKLFQKVQDHRGIVMAYLGLSRVQKHKEQRHAFINKALSLAREGRLPYETALSQWEKSPSPLTSPSALSVFAKLGIPSSVPPRWKDLP